MTVCEDMVKLGQMLSNNRVLDTQFPLAYTTSLTGLSFSSPNLVALEGEIGGGRPARRWGRQEGGVRVLAAARPGQGEGAHGQSSPPKKEEGRGGKGGRRGHARVSLELQ